ncbi:hypothetical protein C0995_009499 [Termitomyces sp. Mi166|nr:hypothetical protein C0995_009499 [Termitomyces sp. Mi166\
MLLGFTGSDPETIDTGTIPVRYESILANKILLLGGKHRITYNIERDMVWHWDRVLKTHPNGMRFSVFGYDGELLATNEYFSVGGGFVVNEKTQGLQGFAELYPGVANQNLPRIATSSQATVSISSPPDYIEVDRKNADVKQSPSQLRNKLRTLASRVPRVVGSFNHAILPVAPRKSDIPAMDFLSCYAIAVNEVNASGGRIVTSPTNGAAGVIPAVLKYIIEFLSDDPEKSIQTFLLTASAIGMLFKRGSTISAAEGGCQAEVGAVKAVTAAQLSMASDGVYSVTLDEAIEAMRLTAQDMSVKYKETSLSLGDLPQYRPQGYVAWTTR